MKYYIKKEENNYKIQTFNGRSFEYFKSNQELIKILSKLSFRYGEKVKDIKIILTNGYGYTLDEYSPKIHGI